MAVNTSEPFTRQAGLRSGLTIRELTGSGYRRLLHGVYIGSQIRPTVAVRARAALMVSATGSFVSHHTAALLWGAWAPLTTTIHVSTPTDQSRSERGGIAGHRARTDVRPVTRAGIPVAPPVEVFIDLAAVGLGLIDLVTAGDALVRAGAVTVDELVDAAARFRGAGCRLARRAARYVREKVDSVMETRLRMLILLAGLPEPEIGHVIRREDGSWLYRLDLCYRGLLIGIEYDGRQHAENSAQWKRDIRRREELEHRGWRIIVITSDGIYDDPQDTLDRIRRVLVERGETAGRRRPGVEWQRCFPARTAG